MNAIRTVLFTTLALSGFSALVLRPALATESPVFLRGDANADGKVSISDALMIRRFIFNGDRPPPCIDAADADDNGSLDLTDEFSLIFTLFFDTWKLAQPAPEVGLDPTPDDGLSCASYSVEPAEATQDLLRIGDVEGNPGDLVQVPYYLTNSVEVEAIQLVIRYDPAVFDPSPSRGSLDFTGTPWEGEFSDGSYFFSVKKHPQEGLLVIGLIADVDLDLTGAAIPAAPEEKLIFRLQGRILPDAPPGSSILLEPTNGPDGQGSRPPLNLLNEIAYRGTARYASFLPRTKGGLVKIVDDITFFTRGDANGDRAVDIADASFLLNHQFLGGPAPRCLDAADADDSGALDITDAIVILGQLFTGEARISTPYPLEGKDSTADNLTPCL